MKLNIPYLLENLTLEEKAGLCSGHGLWWTKAVERLGIPSIMVSDGPHGIRKQSEKGDNLGINASVPAVCFPTGSALASSFDRCLLHKLGEYLGEAARAEGLHTILGPAINIKRSPLCGRNFEYLSEDPFLAGELSANYVNGVQSTGAGVCVKHYAANNQEYKRMSTDTIISERALREIYLTAFEKTVRQSQPWAIMCAYNRINGVYCCENDWLLNKVLRQEWGFEGIVMTDWGAMNDRILALNAGLHLEMPSSHGYNDKKITAAVKNGELPATLLDTRVEQLLNWIDKGLSDSTASNYNKEQHHDFARKAAEDCAVLLKNDNKLLPLSKYDETVFIGSFAKAPRFQGGGSSHINSFKTVSALEAASDIPAITYAQGWGMDGVTADTVLHTEAVSAAKSAKAAVIFAGLPDSFESEGYDRTHLDLPACQNDLIEAVLAVQPNTIVVLHNGSPVLMPWVTGVPAILEMYLAGQASGAAAVNLLFGGAAPSGCLAETFPLRLEDTPCYLSFPGDGRKVVYTEDIYTGYRWYDSRKMPVLFPFGHGLTYTDFELGHISASDNNFSGDSIKVSVEVSNIGTRTGKRVVQLYITGPEDSVINRPLHELKGFEKIELEPGETKTITFTLDKRSFAYYEESISGWRVETGEYTIRAGFSSRDLPRSVTVHVTGAPLPFMWDDSTTVGDLIGAGYRNALSTVLETVERAFGGDTGGLTDDEETGKAMREAMIYGMPVHSLVNFLPMPDNFIESVKAGIQEKNTEAFV